MGYPMQYDRIPSTLVSESNSTGYAHGILKPIFISVGK